MKIGFFVRFVALIIGLGAATLSAFGAWEMQLNVEKTINYLVIAAPFVTISAAAMPVLAERLWNIEHKAKSSFMWLAVIPAATLAFFAAMERVHYSKEVHNAEQRAYVSMRDRLKNEDLVQARNETKEEIRKQDEQLKLKACKQECQDKWKKKVDDAKARENEILGKIQVEEAKIVEKPEVTAPIWLLPATLDLLAFMGVMAAFAPNTQTKQEPKVEMQNEVIQPRRRRRKRRQKTKERKMRRPRGTANDNVISLPSR